MKSFFLLDRNLKLRLTTMFLGALSYGMVGASMTIYYDRYLGAALTGLLLIVFAVLTFVAGFVTAPMSDRYGRKPLIMAGAFTMFVGAILALVANLPFLQNPWLTAVGFLLDSIGSSMAIPAGSAMIIDETSNAHEANRKLVFGLKYWVQNMALTVGALLSALLFQNHFLILLILQLAEVSIEVIIATFLLTETFYPKKQEIKQKTNSLRAYAVVVKDKAYMIFFAGQVLTTMTMVQFENFLPVHLENSFISTKILGFEIYGQRMLTIYLLSGTIFVVLLMGTITQATRKWKNHKGFIFGSIVMALSNVLAFQTRTFLPIFLAGIIYVLGEMVYSPATSTLAADLMNEENIGSYNGLDIVRAPIASVLAGLTVSLSALIHAIGVSMIQLLTLVISIILCLSAVKFQKNAILIGNKK